MKLLAKHPLSLPHLPDIYTPCSEQLEFLEDKLRAYRFMQNPSSETKVRLPLLFPLYL